MIAELNSRKVKSKDSTPVRESKYIYGLIEFNEDARLERPGIAEDQRVSTIPYRDIAAVVSDSEPRDYASLMKDEVARQLVRHQRVLEEALRRFPVIPARLGTYAAGAGETREILARGYEIAKAAFDRIGDKVEIDVAATWSDFNALLKETGETKELRDLKARLGSNPEGATTEDRIAAGLMVKKALDERREASAAAIHRRLAAISCDWRGHDLMDDTMVMNSAFLVARAGQEAFDAQLEELNAGLGGKLNFRRIGPLPPYSFFTLEVRKLGSEEVNWARRIFGLGDTATRSEINKIRRKFAFAAHPDTNPDGTDREKAFNDLSGAWKIINEYARAVEQGGGGEVISFQERDVKRNAILVRFRE